MKKLAALALLAALTLSACGDKDDEKSTDKDTNEGTSQTTDTTETETEATDGGEAPEASGDRPTVDEIVALIEKGEKTSGIDMPDSLTKCLAKGLHDSELSDEQVEDYLAAKADKETTDVMMTVTSECSGM